MERKVFDLPGHVYFVISSCYKRRRLLDDDAVIDLSEPI